MTEQDGTEEVTTCLCGAIQVIQIGMTKVTNLRCWLCPKDNPRPVLRLVKGDELAAALKERDEWKAEAYALADVLPDGQP